MRRFPVVAAVGALWLAACGSPASAQTWETITQNGGYKVARVAMGGAATGIGLTCERGVAVIAINLARTPRRNPALLTLKGGAGSTSMGIIRNGATNVWVASIKEPRLLDMLAAGDRVGVAVDGADYGTASLAGANAAMRTALAGCWRPAMAAKDPPPVRAPAGANTVGGRLTPGLYVPAGTKCAGLDWMDIVPVPCGECEDIGPELIDEGQTFDRREYPARRITSATTFIDGKTRYQLCPAHPYGPVNGLPIRPGLYRVQADDTCGGDGGIYSSAYVLLEPTRAALVAKEYILDRNGNWTKQFKLVRKVTRISNVFRIGAKSYRVGMMDESEGNDLDGFWLIEAPDRFERFGVECSNPQFRPADPRTVPPNLMPRF